MTDVKCAMYRCSMCECTVIEVYECPICGEKICEDCIDPDGWSYYVNVCTSCAYTKEQERDREEYENARRDEDEYTRYMYDLDGVFWSRVEE